MMIIYFLVYTFMTKIMMLYLAKFKQNKNLPIVFDIKKETEIGAGAYFRVYIFEKDSKNNCKY